MKFKVGDIITGNKRSSMYTYTTSKATMEVVGVSKYDIDVKIIAHETFKRCIGRIFLVDPERFILVNRFKQTNYIEE